MDNENSSIVVEPPAAVSGSTAGTWSLHGPGSTVAFDVKKFWGLVNVHGTFSDLDGTAVVGSDGSVAGTLVVGTGSLDTGQAKRDEHLRSDDFLDVERHPNMTVRVDRVDLSAGTGGTAYGSATVVGITQPLTFDVATTVEPVAGTALVSGSTTIDRSRFGIDWSPLKMAAMDVVVSFRLEFRSTTD